MAAAARKLQEEARKTMVLAERQAKAFDEALVAYERACLIPPTEFSNSTSKEKRRVSKMAIYMSPQRERTFGILEVEISKLLRLRAQIKEYEDEAGLRSTWEAISDLRASIDRRHEAWIAVVAESKIKAFSVKSIAREDEITEDERARDDARAQLQDLISRLRIQVDEIEAEAEALGKGKASRKAKDEGAARHEAVIKCLRAHEVKLEALIRLLDNEALDGPEIGELAPEVERFIDEARGAGVDLDASLEMYDAVAQLRSHAAGDGDDDEDEGEDEGNEGAEAPPGSGAGAGAGAVAGVSSGAPRAPALRVCTHYARRGKGGCRFGDACPEHHALIDKAIALGSCAPFLVDACTLAAAGHKCRRLHLTAEEVRARVGAVAAGAIAGAAAAPSDDAVLSEALRPIVLSALREAGGRMGVSALVERPGVAFFLASVRKTHAHARVSAMLACMRGVGLGLRDGVVDAFELAAPPQGAPASAGAGVATAASVSASATAPASAPASAAPRWSAPGASTASSAVASAPSSASALPRALSPEPEGVGDVEGEGARRAAAAALEGYEDDPDADGAMAQAERERHRRDLARLAAARPLGAEEDEAAEAAAALAAANTPERLLSDAAARLAAQRRLLSLRPPRAPRALEDAASAAELLRAVCAGDETLWRLLSDAGAGTEATDGAGATPLLCACLRRDERCATALLAAGADANARDAADRTPLVIASFFGLADVVPLLVAEGADASASGPGRYTPLHWACLMGHDRVALTLLAAAPGSFACASEVGSTPLSLCEAGGGRTPQASAVLGMLAAWGGPGGSASW